jgi:valyl-tRNA synthetase
VDVFVDLRGLVTADQLDARRQLDERRRTQCAKEVATLEKKLGSAGFVDRAPPEVVQETRKVLQTQRTVHDQREADIELVLQLEKELGFVS